MKRCTASTCLGVGRSGRLTRTIARINGGFWAQSMRIPTRSAFCPRVIVSLRRLASIACSTCCWAAVRRAWRIRLRKLPLRGSSSEVIACIDAGGRELQSWVQSAAATMALSDAPSPPPRPRLWRQPYLLLIEASWPRFLLLVTGLYLLIHLLFTALYLVDPAGIGGLSEQMALPLQAFFFSVETMATIGYGALYPLSHWVHLVMTAEALGGLLFLALITGLAFARFERFPASITFAPRAPLGQRRDHSCLLLELRNARPSTLQGVAVRAFWCEPDGAGLIRYQPLELDHPDDIPLEAGLDLRLALPLPAEGPLAGLKTPATRLPPGCGDLLLTVRATDATLERPVHASHRYGPDALGGPEPTAPA